MEKLQMDISLNGAEAVFRTPFSPEYDLLQIFHGLADGPLNMNGPVDFRAAGLQRKGSYDIWHMDKVLALSTDEASPMVINDDDIGCNHSQPCGVAIDSPGHGKSCADIGSLWRDGSGLTWTLLRIENPDRLLFLSENIGPSKEEYAFADQMQGNLTYLSDGLHTAPITVAGQKNKIQMHRAIRSIHRELFYYKDGQRQRVTGDHTGCDRAEIHEEYEIINPATVAEALRANRPAGGYTAPQDLATGEPMMLYRMTYHILADGTVLCDFDHQLLQNVRLLWYLGIMYQEKCDLYDRGIWRYIPKILPFTHKGSTYDFSQPYNTSAGPFPSRYPITPEHWALPGSPPDRQIDFIRGPGGSAFDEGSCVAAFTGGFLPCYDGAPERRRNNITDAVDLAGSRKTYPSFVGGRINTYRSASPERADGKPPLLFSSIRGVAYKKYFPASSAPQDGSSLYTVEYDGSLYLYMDFFGGKQLTQRYSLPAGSQAELLEAGSGIRWEVGPDSISASGEKGYAVFRIALPADRAPRS